MFHFCVSTVESVINKTKPSFMQMFVYTRIFVGLSPAVFKIFGQWLFDFSYNLRSEVHCMQTADCRLQTADCRLQTADCRLQTTDYRLQTTDYRLHTVDLRP